MMPFAEGLRLGCYEIKSSATGSFSGEVYRARHQETGREVYLRVLSHSFIGLGEEVEKVREQLAPAFSLQHIHVLPVIDVGFSGSVLFAVTDYQEGETLRQKMHRSRLQRERASDYSVQIARGLIAVHDAGLLHCDLKPENILITKEHTARVMDAGIADLLFEEAEAAAVEAPILIADYASPEQIRGERETWATDMFSWGVIFYEMLSGSRPFQRPTLAATTRAILHDDIPELKTLRAPALDRIIRQATRKRPEDRFDSARDLVFAIESFGGLTTQANRVRKNVRDERTIPFLVAVAMLILGLAAGALIARRYLRPTVITQLSFRPLTFSGHDSAPAGAPDGKTVALVSDRDGTERIWTMRLDLQDEKPLTSGPDHAPRFSPDGKTLLFIRKIAGKESLYTVSPTGGKPTKVLDNVQSADWSPRSPEIAWLRAGADRSKPVSILGIVSAKGEGARELTRVAGESLQSPRWSTDGRYIAASTNASTFVTRTDVSGQQHTLAPPPTPGQLSDVAWLDGKQLLYFQSVTKAGANGWPGGAANIVRQNVETGATTILGFSQQSALHIDKLSNGSLIFDSNSGRKNLEELVLATGSDRSLTAGESGDQDPAYSADGKSIYFSSFRGGNLEIWSLEGATGAFRRVVHSSSNDSAACLSYDGARLFWSSSREGHFEVYSSSVDGSFAKRLTHDGKDAENPSIGTSGEWVVYNAAQSARSGVWKIRQSGLDDTQVVKGETHWPEVSPDERYVLYTINKPGFREIRIASMDGVVDSDGTQSLLAVQLPFGPGHDESIGKSKWMPGGRAIVFLGESSDGASGVYLQPFTPGSDTQGTRRKLSSFEGQRAVQSFTLSPDGSLLTFAAWERGSGLVQALNVPGLHR